jgi:hypothetical protein
MSRDYRDLVIESLTLEVMNVERERDVWRDLACIAIGLARELTLKHRRTQELLRERTTPHHQAGQAA